MSQTMKLSEAIRLGATVSHQIYGALKDRNGGTCAWGSALHAIGILDRVNMLCTLQDEQLPKDWVLLKGEISFCPEEVCRFHDHTNPLFDMEGCIAHLNDEHKWTREQIADWVQTIEDQLEQSSSEAKAEQKEEQYVATFV